MTAIECLNQICPDTLNLVLNQKGTHYYLAKAMKEYAKAKCKEQRDICADKANVEMKIPKLISDEIEYIVSQESIINSPEPNLD